MLILGYLIMFVGSVISAFVFLSHKILKSPSIIEDDKISRIENAIMQNNILMLGLALLIVGAIFVAAGIIKRSY